MLLYGAYLLAVAILLAVMKENCRGQTLDQGLSGFLRFSKLQRSLLDFCQAVPFDLLGKCPEMGHILQQVLKLRERAALAK